MKRKILITGGAGYIGSAIVHSLLFSGEDVTVIDDLSNGQREQVPKDVKFIDLDIKNKVALKKALSGFYFTDVIHLAAKKAVGESEENPGLYYENNVIGTVNLLETISVNPEVRLIFSSTAAVYSESNSCKPVMESDPLKPINIYGHTKLVAEEVIKHYQRLGRIGEYVIFRYFNVAGDSGLRYLDKQAKNVFPLLAKAYTSEEEFSIYGDDYETADGTCVRDYIHVSDIVEAHRLALQSSSSGTYNLGSSHGYSVRDLIQTFDQVTGKKLKVVVTKRRPGDPAYLVADSTIVRDVLGWKPNRDLRSMVESSLSVL